jgi:hypothetical protein
LIYFGKQKTTSPTKQWGAWIRDDNLLQKKNVNPMVLPVQVDNPGGGLDETNLDPNVGAGQGAVPASYTKPVNIEPSVIRNLHEGIQTEKERNNGANNSQPTEVKGGNNGAHVPSVTEGFIYSVSDCGESLGEALSPNPHEPMDISVTDNNFNDGRKDTFPLEAGSLAEYLAIQTILGLDHPGTKKLDGPQVGPSMVINNYPSSLKVLGPA